MTTSNLTMMSLEHFITEVHKYLETNDLEANHTHKLRFSIYSTIFALLYGIYLGSVHRDIISSIRHHLHLEHYMHGYFLSYGKCMGSSEEFVCVEQEALTHFVEDTKFLPLFSLGIFGL
jgi:hypothetical protein